MARLRYAVFFLTSDSNSARKRFSSRSTRKRSLSKVSMWTMPVSSSSEMSEYITSISIPNGSPELNHGMD